MVSIRAWLHTNWFYAGLTAGLFLFAIAPLLSGTWSLALILVFLQLPVYMVHQIEEHNHDRFRRFVNGHVAGGLDALTPDAILVTNIGGVWLVDMASLYLARFVDPGLGLIAVYLAIFNALLHIVGALVLRAYNPGLVSAVLLLLPAGCAGWWILYRSGACSAADTAVGIGVAIAVHVAIIGWIRYRIGRLKRLAGERGSTAAGAVS